ncbi:hypothetical protein [Agrobacterium rosae]|uniref:hypothetical protein n=1 Tax=Agrobacterium rosae TaxID=1972867 RepID=UPI00203462E5|nr:hypothetical protein [Agrobacterium rosae]MCM2435927.1 hypothetical protein [Agrobacterium rosae]
MSVAKPTFQFRHQIPRYIFTVGRKVVVQNLQEKMRLVNTAIENAKTAGVEVEETYVASLWALTDEHCRERDIVGAMRRVAVYPAGRLADEPFREEQTDPCLLALLLQISDGVAKLKEQLALLKACAVSPTHLES